MSMLSCVAVPFMSKYIDHTLGKWIWFFSAVIVFVFGTSDWLIRHKSKDKKAFDIFIRGSTITTLLVFGSAFVINYFDTKYNWYWAIAAFVFIIFPIEAFNFHEFYKSQNRTEEEKKHNLINTWKQIALDWLFGLFYISCFNSWLYCQFIFGFVSTIIVFYNISSIFLNREVNKAYLLFDFFLGVGISVYLIYLIPNTDLRNIILTIIAALYGGLITLIGVAWTIIDGKKRESETKRLECMPFLQLEIPQQNVNTLFEIELPLCKDNASDTIYKNLILRNLGNGTAANITYTWKFDKQEICECGYPPINAIMKGDQYSFQLTLDADDTLSNNSVAVLNFGFDDLLGNSYEQRVALVFEENDIIRCETNPPVFLGKVVYKLSKSK